MSYRQILKIFLVAIPFFIFTSSVSAGCTCSGRAICSRYTNFENCSDHSCNWKCTSTPTPTRQVPTPTPNSCCYGNPGCGNYNNIEDCLTYSCDWNSSCVVPTSIPTPTPTPPPASNICSPGSTVCIDPPLNTSIGPSLKTCNASGSSWNTTYCSEFQVCNKAHDSCTNRIVTVPVSPECTNTANKCLTGIKYVCVGGEWLPTNSGGCGTLLPTPKPPTTAYDCQIKNGKVICPQNYPLWSSAIYPYACYNDTQEKVINTNSLGLYGCGQSTVCSMLCECPNTNNQTFCNVKNCVQAISEYSEISCRGTGIDINAPILKKYSSQCFQSINQLVHDIHTSPLQISRDEIAKYASLGDVMVQALFVDKITGKQYSHNSRVCGTDNGQLVFCDTFFNQFNSDPNLANITDKLEDRFDITYFNAASIIK